MHKAGFINIIGKPNAGKSTLMNALVGEKMSIITPKAQTTRHRIIGIVNHDDFQMVFSDTPGIIKPKYGLHERMMDFVKSSMHDADVMVLVVDLKDPDPELEDIADKLVKRNCPLIILLNKVDAVQTAVITEQVDIYSKLFKPDALFPISALMKANLEPVMMQILNYLPDSPPFFDKEELTDKPERFFIAEIIREKIFLNYKKEIPYSTEVVIESFKEEKNILRIAANILVERKSQKPIVIGRGGEKLKRVGTHSREDIEAFLGKKVFLELYVKVVEDWRNKDSHLKNFGYRQ
ncbi:MAG: GTP-binding protein Era [Sphingobacteriales bacterium]|jgi:GTP-binding protein Era